MVQKLNNIRASLLILCLTIISCDQELTVVTESPQIKIVMPINYLIVKEYDKITVKVETNLNQLKNVELFGKYSDLMPEFHNISNDLYQAPYEFIVFIQQICLEIDTLTLFAKATYNSNEEIISNQVTIIVKKNIPPDDSLPVFDYEGYSLDSTLVAFGSFSFFLNDDNSISGRKNINAVVIDSAFEKGNGFIEGLKHISSYGEYHIQLNVCYLIHAGGEFFININGNLNGNVLSGSRYLSSYGPEYLKVGSFRATKRN